jgi:autotransporter adhesin
VGANAGSIAGVNGATRTVVANGATALGAQSLAQDTNTTAIGFRATATQAGSTALGYQAVASAPNAVALGANAVADRANTVSLGLPGGERQITNVAAGTQATDAVNLRQLQAAREGTVSYATHADGSTNHSSVVLGNGLAAGGTTLSNVAPGVAGTDAVNLNQLQARSAELGNQINTVGRYAYSGVAAAMAVQMPTANVPGKTAMRLGYGIYRGESAVGISARHTAAGSAWSLGGGVGIARGGAAATVGAEWVFQ